MLTLEALRAANLARSLRWMSLYSWSVMEWACAMAGKADEACNVAKKISRVEKKFAKRIGEYIEDFNSKLAEECADTLIYLDLLCASRGINLAEAVIKKFNKVSEEFNFPERLEE